MSQSRQFIIHSYGYSENTGGSIALHRLCDLINRSGRDAYLCPIVDPLPADIHKTRPVRRAVLKLRDWVNKKTAIDFKTFHGFRTPVKLRFNVDEAIVVYPEIIAGNPLNAKNVVRWLLHKPGFHTGVVDYGPADLIFYYQEAFNSNELKQVCGGQLYVQQIRKDIYRQTNFGKRTGTCYILRKGAGRQIVHDLRGSILIDGLSHHEAADVFNRVEVCYSYDLYTSYSQYAAMCGCVSVIIPDVGKGELEWHPEEGSRLGIAYGVEQIEWAKKTQSLVASYLDEKEKDQNKSVSCFINKCDEYFL